jgi:hypothetical protein
MILIALHCTAPRARARAHKAASCDLIPTARIFLSNLITSHSPAPPVQSAEPGWIKVVQLAIGCESPIRAACTGAVLEARARHAQDSFTQDFPTRISSGSEWIYGNVPASQHPHSTEYVVSTARPAHETQLAVTNLTQPTALHVVLPCPKYCAKNGPRNTHSLTHSLTSNSLLDVDPTVVENENNGKPKWPVHTEPVPNGSASQANRPRRSLSRH